MIDHFQVWRGVKNQFHIVASQRRRRKKPIRVRLVFLSSSLFSDQSFRSNWFLFSASEGGERGAEKIFSPQLSSQFRFPIKKREGGGGALLSFFSAAPRSFSHLNGLLCPVLGGDRVVGREKERDLESRTSLADSNRLSLC